MTSTRGAELARLLLAAYEGAVDEVVSELSRAGHPGVTATLEFALVAIEAGARDASALGRAVGVSKQAAAKTITTLEQLGYVERLWVARIGADAAAEVEAALRQLTQK